MQKTRFLLLGILFSLVTSAQENLSIGSGVSVLRNFSPQQDFWALGHTIQVSLHFTPTESAYAWAEYYTEGKYHNTLTATAKAPGTQPQQLALRATGRLAYRHFSLGWKHYFRGGYANGQSLNVYGLAGFGFLFAQVKNDYAAALDTMLYKPVAAIGSGTVRKLSFDAGLGAEQPLNGTVFLFADLRTWLPASSNESPFLHNQRNLPLPVMVSAGIRVLIGPVQ